MTARVHIVVEGVVQGVGFRWFVARRAEELGLLGFVKNLYDGSVEIEAEGDRSRVEDFIGDIRVGPRSAHITNVRIAWQAPLHLPSHFEIR